MRQIPTARFHHDWMFRDAAEEARFIRLARRGWETGQVQIEGDVQMAGGVSEFDRLLTSVLDAQYAKSGKYFTERYMPWPDRHGSNQVIFAAGGGDGNLVKRVLQWPRLSQQFLEYDNLRPDGLHTNIFNSSTRGAGIAMYPASKLTTGAGWHVGENGGPYPTSGGVGNVAYYQGGVAFWVKFDFNAADPIFSGLVGCTQVVRDVGQTPRHSEGNQFYIFKTSFGELRMVRMYYHRAFGVPSMHGSNGLLPPPREEDVAAIAGEEDEDIETDPNKGYARSEVVVDISGWGANEWHHVAVVWNDMDRSERRVRAFVDFQVADAFSTVQYGLLGESDFVALNTKVPYDELTVGGVIRRQAEPLAGLFKFSYNIQTAVGRTGGGSSVAGRGNIGGFVFPDLKIFPANATIDEFVSFEGPFETFLSTQIGRIRGYYTQNRGRYHNVFEISLPLGAEAVRLRSFTWTEYQPPFFHGPKGNVVNLQGNPVRSTVYLRGIRRTFQRAPWQETSGVAKNRVAGVILRAPTGKGFANEPVEVVYRFDMDAVRGSGQYGGMPIATPIVDDVTLTYFLPSTQVLLWEDLPVNYEALERVKQGGIGGRRRTLGSSRGAR
jgi:hypothetical protein